MTTAVLWKTGKPPVYGARLGNVNYAKLPLLLPPQLLRARRVLMRTTQCKTVPKALLVRKQDIERERQGRGVMIMILKVLREEETLLDDRLCLRIKMETNML